MENPQISQKLAAEQDASDISALRKVPGFERYFLRRLKERKEAFAKKVLDNEADPQTREHWRQIYLEYVDLCKMVDQDEANAVKLLRD